jgi:uncharacterized protein (DUF924 family)
MQVDRAEQVLDFWFGSDEDSGEIQEKLAARWFVRDDAFDAQIRTRFGDLVDAAIGGELGAWNISPRSWLALLLLLDQFPRNLYRDSALAFSGDEKAQRTALAGIARGDDLALPVRCRAFAYLPLEHAEDLPLQRRCVALFEALATNPEARPAEVYRQYLAYAQRHCDVIQRFGRFPHRNRVLGRRSTPDEQAYLDAGGGF